MKIFLLFAISGAICLGGCQERPPLEESATPGQRHHLSVAEVAAAEKAAALGDKDAVTRLINHYQWGVSDEGKALQWLRRGADLGDGYAMINLASQLSARADEASCKEAEALLERVVRSSEPKSRAIAEGDLVTLRGGVDGSGYCTNWLSPPSDAK